MIMDYLRSCYSTNMWVFNPQLGVFVQFTAKWFKAPVGAQVLPVRHQYRSNNWSKGIPYPEQIGEVIGHSVAWSNGAAVTGYNGLNYCGTQWTGILDRLHTPIPSHPDGSPACCTAVITCARCLGGKAKGSYTLVATGGTGSFAAANGTFVLPSTTTCTWAQPTGLPQRWTFNHSLVDTNANVVVGASSAFYDQNNGGVLPNCLAPIPSLPLVSHTGSGTPPSISIT
jgi:hypothetical protein